MCSVLVVQWADVLALSGDSADNIPGVKGVGIKTAPNLVRAHGDVEGVLAAAPNEKKKVAVVLCLCPLLQLGGQTSVLHQVIAHSLCCNTSCPPHLGSFCYNCFTLHATPFT